MHLCEFTQIGDKDTVLINPMHIVFARSTEDGAYIVTTAINSSGRNQFFLVDETLEEVRERVNGPSKT
ncbi:hypothetical protein ABLE91_17310 [Aquabacter sp. CN5-332]